MLYDPKWEAPTEITLEPWQEILMEAAAILDRDGWVRGAMHSASGHCIVGAIAIASRGEILNREVATRHLHRYLGDEPMGWNDGATGLNKKVVSSTLRSCAGYKRPEGIVVNSTSWTGR